MSSSDHVAPRHESTRNFDPVDSERNSETNARLEDAGIEVVPIAGSELGSGRGGPRCMSCPVLRDPLPA